MTIYLVAVHILIDTTGADPRSAVSAILERQLDGPPASILPAGAIVDWAVAGEDLAASMTPAVIPPGYTAGSTPFPDWHRLRAGRTPR
ncbi:hypothetical protein [Chelativorans sp. AA-79]|uniref:hypothetical protein n=1 Tax=Chelativorans sp. AA-79 TaxID=3028735 RepID=UPI0023F6638D|nr:hypothetical protein [Chelativorans sp. AA-79]WEX12138.1 hypothetical protein PVE73_26995 [Chelativorans sp. AA-79]